MGASFSLVFEAVLNRIDIFSWRDHRQSLSSLRPPDTSSKEEGGELVGESRSRNGDGSDDEAGEPAEIAVSEDLSGMDATESSVAAESESQASGTDDEEQSSTSEDDISDARAVTPEESEDTAVPSEAAAGTNGSGVAESENVIRTEEKNDMGCGGEETRAVDDTKNHESDAEGDEDDP